MAGLIFAMPALWPALLLTAAAATFLAATPPRGPRLEAFASADGTRLEADFYPARRGPGAHGAGVVLLPMLGGQRLSWAAFASSAAARGLSLLALDPRGHGASANPAGSPPASWGRRGWEAVVEDARAAVRRLEGRGIPKGRILIVGASIGGSVALHLAASEPSLAGAALLSPGDNPARLPASEALAAYGGRPLFIAAAAEDGDFPLIAKRLAAGAVGRPRLKLLAGTRHGTGLLEDSVQGGALSDELIAFLLSAAQAP